jgi:hypothetical protein
MILYVNSTEDSRKAALMVASRLLYVTIAAAEGRPAPQLVFRGIHHIGLREIERWLREDHDVDGR